MKKKKIRTTLMDLAEKIDKELESSHIEDPKLRDKFVSLMVADILSHYKLLDHYSSIKFR